MSLSNRRQIPPTESGAPRGILVDMIARFGRHKDPRLPASRTEAAGLRDPEIESSRTNDDRPEAAPGWPFLRHTTVCGQDWRGPARAKAAILGDGIIHMRQTNRRGTLGFKRRRSYELNVGGTPQQTLPSRNLPPAESSAPSRHRAGYENTNRVAALSSVDVV
jgi:hypothetical protein